jgi:hypothetical protein
MDMGCHRRGHTPNRGSARVEGAWGPDCALFLQQVLAKCTHRPTFLVDRAPRYRCQLTRLGVRWRHVTFGLRNHIDGLFRHLKDRSRTSYHNYGTNGLRRGILNIGLFLHLFAWWYNELRWELVRPDQVLFSHTNTRRHAEGRIKPGKLDANLRACFAPHNINSSSPHATRKLAHKNFNSGRYRFFHFKDAQL